jgi:hypothetical protein
MKCIQSIKATKQVEVGTIRRVNDKEADSEVKGGYWKYIPKNEWKKSNGKPQTENQVTNKEENEKTQSKKQINRSKIKEKQRQ